MAKGWYPIIDEEQCISCGTCVEFCKNGVFVVGEDGLPQVVEPDNCVEFCRGCAKICPAEAISYFGDIE